MTYALGPNNAFVEQWRREAHIEYSKQEAAFKGKSALMKDKATKGHIPVFDDADRANIGKARHADVNITPVRSDEIVITTQPIYIAYMIDDWDACQTSVDLRAIYNTKAMSAVNRMYDEIHINALSSTTNAEVDLPTANTFNFAATTKMLEQFSKARAPKNNRYGAISPAAATDLRNDANFTNNFHNPFSLATADGKNPVSTFELFEETELKNGAAGSTERRCLFWQKDALVTFMPQDLRVTIDWDPRAQGYLYVASMVVGAKIVENKGVWFCDITE